MCEVDVLDLSVRCQSQPLPSIENVTNWTTSSTPMVQVDTSPPWSNSTVSRGAQYELEPISPSSSPGSHPPPPPPPPSSSYLADAFYPRPPVDPVPRQSPAGVGRWSSKSAVVTTSTTHPVSSVPRRWNGDGGHPYSPLKRALHQYCSNVEPEENSSGASSSSSGSGSSNGADVLAASASSSSTALTSSCTGRKPTTTTAGMSFEEFVLGMLSKVGGGKAITAATQSYLRDSATTTASNRGGAGTTVDARTTTADDVQPQGESAQRTRYDERTPYQTPPEQRRLQMERQMTTAIHRDEYGNCPSLSSSYHQRLAAGPGVQYSAPRPPPDLRLLAPPPPGAMRRPPTRVDDRDDAYRERRRKNNEAAKRSRDTRRFKELQVAAQAERLAEENLQLKAEIAVLRSQLGYLHRMMLDNNNGSNVNAGVNGTDDEHRNNSTHQYTPPEDGGRTV